MSRAPSAAARPIYVACLAVAVGIAMAFVAHGFIAGIRLIRNLAYFGRLSVEPAAAAEHALGWLSVFVPALGGLVVGLIARFGSSEVRGYGVPEVMEHVLVHESRISPRLFFLRPLSAAFAIGTGAPFGAEGPVITTGGALGSIVGQVLTVSANERKTLLAAGAAAGVSATFGAPIAGALLAVELLLFELNARSALPVALASAAAAGVRALFTHAEFFAMRDLPPAGPLAWLSCAAIGAAMGVLAAATTRALYMLEDAFERLPVHWMWWPAIGGLGVGLFGRADARSLGAGYANIAAMLSGSWAEHPLRLCSAKLGSWLVALASGSSGGALSPLLTVGAGLGGALGQELGRFAPPLAPDPRLAALVGMAGLFAGSTGAVLASAVFAIETTLEGAAFGPVLAACAAAALVARRLHPRTLMTERIARHGIAVPEGFGADALDRVSAGQAASPVAPIGADEPASSARRRLGDRGVPVYPVLDARGFVGLVGRADLARAFEGTAGGLAKGPDAWVYADATLREAAAVMAREGTGFVAVMTRSGAVVGVLTRQSLVLAVGEDTAADTPR